MSEREPLWKAYLGPILTVVVVAVVARAYWPQIETWFGLESETQVESEQASDDGIAYHTCPMHPSVQAAEMGQCPICNMDLVPVTKADLEAGRLTLDPQRLQRIGVRSEAVAKRTISRPVVAQGELRMDETRTSEVTLLTSGWVRRLRVEETGEYVKRGQTLFELYSPEIQAASDEYIAARKAGGGGRERLMAAARRKLTRLGVSKRQIDRLEKLDRSPETLAIPSPSSGFVITKHVAEGSRVEQGAVLFELARLDRLWVDAQVYERDLGRVELDAVARVSPSHAPERSYAGKVSYVHPRLDADTRTLRVRVVLDEETKDLIEGMYARVEIETPTLEGLAIPREAVIHTGKRRLVFVDEGEGKLMPREVELGDRDETHVLVRSGLEVGERVVSSGNFLIAAESRIRSAEAIWAAPPEAPEPEAVPVEVTGAYVCPMHPEVQSDEPGTCPTCNMNLVERVPAKAAYVCPMHPEVTSDEPGLCPKCNMKLVASEGGEGEHAHGH